MTKKAFTPAPERTPALLIWHPRLPSARLVWGFTLIELLVVISIIGLLASIVLASIKSFQQRATIAKTLQYGKSVDNLLAADAVGIWNFDDQTNPTKDTSGWANHGTINGAAFTDDTPHRAAGAGAGKYSLSFNGSSDYVNLPTVLPSPVAPYSVSLWFYPQTLNKTQTLLFIKGANPADYPAFNLQSNNRLLAFAGSEKYRYGNKTFSQADLNQWWHIVFVVKSGASLTDWKVYLNGLDNTGSPGANTGNYYEPGSSGRIGNGQGYFQGLIDEVRIFSRPLIESEIQKLYAEGAARHGIVLK